MRRSVFALIPLLLVMAACQSDVTMWGSCTVGADGNPTGTDGTYVLTCRNGRWEPTMTVEEFGAILRGAHPTIAPLPTPPESPPGSTTTSTSTSTSTSTMPDPPQFVSIAAGAEHTCGLTDAGGVKCWGRNNLGQLGDGTFDHRHSPVDVVGLTSGVTAITTLSSHTCALTTAGGVKCWGSNGWNQLGDGTTIDRNEPVDVADLTEGATAVDAGGHFTCAVVQEGAKCWGYNHVNQLGDGSTILRPAPTYVSGLTGGVASVTAGVYHACALTSSGGAKCWGLNSYGRVGDGTTTNRPTPVDVSGLTSGVASLEAGQTHTCAVTSLEGAKCWGFNNAGRLGDGTTTNRSSPVDVSGLTSGVASIAPGDRQTCAVTTGGAALCWGFNGYGQLGDGTNSDHSTPAGVSGLTSGVTSLAAGGYHSCGVVSGEGRCWGLNDYGQLGDGSAAASNSPVTVDL